MFKGLDDVMVGEVTVPDDDDGKGMASSAASPPSMGAGGLRSLAESTGVDVPKILSEGGRNGVRRSALPSGGAL